MTPAETFARDGAVCLRGVLTLPMIALLLFTRRDDIMGSFVNGRVTKIAAICATAAVLVLNAFLIAQLAGVDIPGLK